MIKQKFILNLVGIYDLILSFGSINLGIKMILGKDGFSEYPQEWLTKVPFQSWFLPGVIGIIVFGIGNFIAAICTFRKKGMISWIASPIMATIFFLSMITQYLIFRENYLPASILFILSIIQLLFCGLAYLVSKSMIKGTY